MTTPLRVVHYLNQFFGGIGSEEAAGAPPQARDGAVGPGLALQKALGGRGQVVGTVICGDNTLAEDLDRVAGQVVDLIAAFKPGLVVAGPAFQAGRYGVACGRVCQEVQDRLQVPAITAMHPENPGVALYRRRALIAIAPATAAGMATTMEKIVGLGLRLVGGEAIGPAVEEGYFSQGVRKNRLLADRAATRAVRMLIAKLHGEPFQTELAIPRAERVPPAPAIADLSRVKIALVTEGAIVPKGNPGRLEVGWATRWQKYSIAGLRDLTPETHQAIHAGYDNRFANEDPDRVLPLDALVDLADAGVIGGVHDEVCVTSGMATFVENAERFGREIAAVLRAAGVSGVVLTGT